jgi:phosphoglycolate phosphatase
MSEPLPAPRACVFDLDGTLVDSLRDIALALNDCLRLLGLPEHPVERYRYMVGEGVPKLCERAVGDTHPHLVGRLAELARARYRSRILAHTRPYPGITHLVQRLHNRGVRLAVLSNKPHELTRRVVHAFWGTSTFRSVYGYIEEAHRKPSPKYLLKICAELDVPPQQTWMIGDTPTDVLTASAAGAVPVGVNWGFRPRDDLITAGARVTYNHPDELA